jgi:hypothetical protein
MSLGLETFDILFSELGSLKYSEKLLKFVVALSRTFEI